MPVMVNNRLRIIQRWLWPRNCLLCAAATHTDQGLCSSCAESLPRPANACPCCAAKSSDPEIPCGECQQRPPDFTFARAAFVYSSPIDRLIQHLKYHQRLELSRVLGGYLANAVASFRDKLPDVVVPVPLHPSRLRERGFNQSLEIARFVAAAHQLPLDYQHARRIRPTAPQTELPREQRRKNVHGAFEADKDVFAGKRVAIVDDVMTSGHTANTLASTLLRSGAAEVRAWVVARA